MPLPCPFETLGGLVVRGQEPSDVGAAMREVSRDLRSGVDAVSTPESRCVSITKCSQRFFMRQCCWTGTLGVASVSQFTKAAKAGHKASVGRGPVARAPGSYSAGQ